MATTNRSNVTYTQGGVEKKTFPVSESLKLPQNERYSNTRGENTFDNSLFNMLSSNIFKQENDDNIVTTGEGMDGVKLPRDQVRTAYENINLNLNEFADKGMTAYMNTPVQTGIDLSYQPIQELRNYETGDTREVKTTGKGKKGGFSHLFNILEKANTSYSPKSLESVGSEGWLETYSQQFKDEFGEGNVTLENFEDMDKDYREVKTSETVSKLPYVRAFAQMKNDIKNEFFGEGEIYSDSMGGFSISGHAAMVAKEKFDAIVQEQEIDPKSAAYSNLQGEFVHLFDLVSANEHPSNKSSDTPLNIGGSKDSSRNISEKIFGNNNVGSHNWERRFSKK
jgi:hypothetical protein